MDNINPIEEERLLILLQRFIRQNLNPAEKAELQRWSQLSPENQRLLDDFKGEEFLHHALHKYGRYSVDHAFQKTKSHIITRQPETGNSIFLRPDRWKYMVAAMLLLTLGFVFVLTQDKKTQQSNALLAIQDVNPGGNRASLTLANGRRIDLSDRKEGLIIGKEKLTYTDGGEIAMVSDQENLYSILSVPVGGQYQIILSDGTKVWLNSASSLKYPARFSNDERKVELTGEAYFEVSKIKSDALGNKRVSFVVKTLNQEVEVLGTHFNINAYTDEQVIKTTLLEGAVRISYQSNPNQSIQAVLLKPNQQSVITTNGIGQEVITLADPTSVIAWKNGLFDFQDKKLDEVMRQLARWYNLDIVYEGAVPKMEFFGKIRRNNKLSEVLHILKRAGIHFRLENGRKLVISQALADKK